LKKKKPCFTRTFFEKKKDGEETFCEESHQFTIPWKPSLTALSNWNRGQLKVTMPFYTQLSGSAVCHGQKKCLQTF